MEVGCSKIFKVESFDGKENSSVAEIVTTTEIIDQKAQAILPFAEWFKQLKLSSASDYDRFITLVNDPVYKTYIDSQEILGKTTPVIFFAKKRESGAIIYLIKAGADLTIQDEFFGNTALMHAIANASNTIAIVIMKMGGCRPYLDVQCKYQNTALILAVGKGYKKVSREGEALAIPNLTIVKELIKHKANIHLVNRDGNSPLHLAAYRREMLKC